MTETQVPTAPGGTRRLDFENGRGERLAAVLDLPDGAPRATALFAHCFTCGKDLRSARLVSRGLAERGFAVLRFDFTGLGESGGEFAGTTFSGNLDDLEAASAALAAELEAPSLLVGHSLGGAAVLRAAPRLAGVRAVATIGAPSTPSHLREGVLSEVDADAEETEVSIGGRTFRVRSDFLRDLDRHDAASSVEELGVPLMILHSPVDDVVSIDHARAIYEAARHPKSFVSLDGADHLLLANPRDAVFVADLLATWADRYLPERETALVEGDDLAEGLVQVRGTTVRYTMDMRARSHHVVLDEPESLGGRDAGPTPYEMLLGALGGCIAATLRIVADREEMPLESVRVRLHHGRIHARDCRDCESGEGMIDVIEKDVEVVGPELTVAQQERLLTVASRCPVHRTLTSETRIRTLSR